MSFGIFAKTVEPIYQKVLMKNQLNVNMTHMKVNGILSILYVIFLLLFSNEIKAQKIFYDEYLYLNDNHNQGVILNAELKIESYGAYLEFLKKLFESDQKYRKDLQPLDMKRDSVAFWKLVKLMKNNDKVNQIILLKLLKKFGWPCNKDIQFSFNAWIIIWHSEIIDRNDFYPYLKEALKKGCILKEHYQQFKIQK